MDCRSSFYSIMNVIYPNVGGNSVELKSYVSFTYIYKYIHIYVYLELQVYFK